MFLLVLAFPFALWALSEPMLAAAIVALVSVASVVLAGILRAAFTASSGRSRRICVPRTGVCVEL